MNYSAADWIAGIMILLATLMIPIAIRKWMIRGPMDKLSALFIAAGIWFSLLLFFYWAAGLVDQQGSYSGRSHFGIFAVAAISYWILTHDRKDPAARSATGSSIRDEEPSRASHRENAASQRIPLPVLTHLGMLSIGLVFGYFGSTVLEAQDEGTTYEDCVLERMPDAKTREAAHFIRNACREKYKNSSVESKSELTATFPQQGKQR